MNSMTIILGIVCVLLLIACAVLAKIAFSLYGYHRDFEEHVEERVNTSLRALDACYTNISIVAAKPVFFDSPEVRSVVAAIQRARDAVLYVVEVFEDVVIEDNTQEVEPKDVPAIGSEPAPEPDRNMNTGADESRVLREKRRRELHDAVVGGRMQVLDPVGSYSSQPMMQGVDAGGSPNTARLHAALNRHAGNR